MPANDDGGDDRRLTGKRLWGRGTVTADSALDLVLSSTRNLPIRYWQERFLFFGAEDENVHLITAGAFPVKLVPNKSHPVLALAPMPGGVGWRVCPCSSKRSFGGPQGHYIRQGCRLDYTRHEMDRDSYPVWKVVFPFPASRAGRLLFKGQVPEECFVRP